MAEQPAAQPVAATESLIEDAGPAGAESAAAAKETTPDSAKPEGGEGKGGGEPSEVASLLDEAEGQDGKSPEKADGQADATKQEGAPEAYAAFDLPDGMKLDEGAVALATPIFRDLNLNQAQAQKLVSLYAVLAANTATGIAEQQAAARASLLKQWTDQTRNHPQFGGDNLAKSKGLVNKAIFAFSDSPAQAAELKSLLKETGLGNNPLLFSLLCRAAAKLDADRIVHGDASAQNRPRTLAQQIYPNMPGDNQ